LQYNKGLAFSHHERDRLYLRGLLPPAVLSQEIQAERVILNIRNMPGNIQKVTYLLSLQERNEQLFYHVLQHHVEELSQLLQYPAIGEYCREYSLMFRSLPRGLYLSLEDKGHVSTIIKNWPERRVKAICLTDGEVVGTLGDLGVQAIAAPISRLALFVALGGVDPSTCLPVTIDNGTDREELLSDPLYVGVHHRRVRDDAYFELLEEFFLAVRRRFGASVLIDLEGMSWVNQTKILSTYRGTFPVYSDTHYGLPTLALAAIMAAQPATKLPLGANRFLLVGESAALCTVAELIEDAIQRDSRGGTVLEARQAIHLVDSKGLVVRSRADAEDLEDHKLPYIQDMNAAECPDLLSAIKQVKPTVLIGLSDGTPPHAFTKEILEAMAENCERPVILPMSLHTADGAEGGGEVSAIDAYTWTKGTCFFADRHTTGEITVPGMQGKALVTALNTAHIFPGVGLGALMSRSTRLREEMFVEVAKTLSRLVSEEEVHRGALMPPITHARDVAAHVAATLAHKAYQAGVASELPKPHDMLEKAYHWMYDPKYKRYK
jgi:malate dehydrogenase (oxaloacetate-decarboxylating)(NADP+)